MRICSPQGIAQHYLTGNADGLRTALEDVLSRQHQMLDILEEMVGHDEHALRRLG